MEGCNKGAEVFSALVLENQFTGADEPLLGGVCFVGLAGVLWVAGADAL